MSSSEVLASSSTAGTPDDGRCVASRQSDGERCTKKVSERWAEFGRYCPTHGKMIKAQRKSEQLAIEAREREARELASSDALAGEMEAMTELFEQLSTRMEELERKAAEDEALGGKRMKTVRSATKTVLTNHKGLIEAKDTLMSSVADVRAACERDEENRKLKEEIDELMSSSQENHERLTKAEKDVTAMSKKIQKLTISREGEFMTRAAYRKFLEDSGIDIADCDVFHIIASAHGGPDHTDNFLFALGSSFNRQISHHLDALNCFLAGKEKCVKAVEIARRVAADKRLWEHVEMRGRRRVLYTQGVHRHKDGHALYREGNNLIRDLRRAALEHRKKSAAAL